MDARVHACRRGAAAVFFVDVLAWPVACGVRVRLVSPS